MRLRLDSLRGPTLAGPYLMLLAVHVPIIAQGALYAAFGSLGGIRPSGYPWLSALSCAMIFGLQLRHSLALARGERPRGGVWTLLALAVLAYAPLHWLGLNWFSEQMVLMASVPMVLDGWLAAMAIAGQCAYIGIQLADVFPAHPGPASYAIYIYWVAYYTATITVVPAALYASARLVRVAGEQRATQIALAQGAVGRERLRVSRDVHDLIGHSLSTISLKGDLAIRLLQRDRPAAVEEIQSLTEAAREALAWAVREGTTNVIRHATAATAVITLQRDDGVARLEILNDGAHHRAGTGGSGLSGLDARIQDLSGTLTHGRLSEGWFRLTAQVPVTATEEPHWPASGCSSPKTST